MAQEKDYLILLLGYSKAPFEVIVLALKDFERRFLREARTPAERLHLQQLTASDMLVEAYGEARPWKDFGPPLRRIKQLGFPDLRTHILIACLYVQSLSLFPERARDAFAMLDEAERRVRRMRGNPDVRQKRLEGIEQARRTAEAQGISPPAVAQPRKRQAMRAGKPT
ncbi:hypothetical protein [Hyalangium rubrum]|uniref:Uncharacterized protein n=1 Tax=Hyalangium rubrum TaxID=3103134 RepID=A0ABU5HCY1_9BACT|nr:hypothetical protein [Hyalangium sp. s54d21]MDY7230964.1 hypothetical protein [Hyalangium sp. s54d21]